jgi:hypothetical protein
MMAKKKEKQWKLHAMTKEGCATLFKFYKDRYNVRLIKDRELDTNGVTWTFTITHPFPDEVD